MLHISETRIEVSHYQMLIGGQWKDTAGGKVIERLSPAHDTLVSRAPAGTAEDADQAISAAETTHRKGSWRHLPQRERSNLLLQVADRIRQDRDELALVESLESGKPYVQAKMEVELAANLWQYASGLTVHGDSYNNLENEKIACVVREPIGVVSIITPWNFPLLIVSQKLPFALAAGCTTVIKPSELTPGTTFRLGAILQEIGFPPGVVNIVNGYGDTVGQRLVEHPAVRMISFTGSSPLGKKIAAVAGSRLKHVELELGGKNPFVLFADAKQEEAADALAFGLCFNAGECCNSSSRLIVEESCAESFFALLKTKLSQVKVGDPLDEKTQVGAIIHREHYDKICACLQKGLDAGAELIYGSEPLQSSSGLFLSPSVLLTKDPSDAIIRDEIFGPVLSVMTFKSRDEAMALANATDYGLSAGVWTGDLNTAMLCSRDLEAGTVWVNTWMDGYPELPFGGKKNSGLGRELGRFSIEAFTELKTVDISFRSERSPWVSPS